MRPTPNRYGAWLIALLCAVVAPAATAAAETTSPVTRHRVLSCNILVDQQANIGKYEAWTSPRKDVCISLMKKYAADIICTQEVIRNQSDDLEKAFPDYQLIGFAGPEMDARPNGYEGIAKNVILFSKKKYDLVTAGNYWLSKTPLIAASTSWDEARPRSANWVRLRDKSTGKQFRVINTHLDHKGKIARPEQVKVIIEESAQYLPEIPQLLVGDLNSTQTMPAITELKNAGWTDSWTELHGPQDPGGTVHMFKPDDPAMKKRFKIDYIMYDGPVKPLASEIIKDNDNGQYPSDHYFLYADLEF